jgi:hypothetical protein
MEIPEIRAVVERIENENTKVRALINEQKALRTEIKKGPGRPKRAATETPRISIKDTPPYNPNAQINTLAFTIPSWVSIIEKSIATSDFNEISSDAQDKLTEELNKLATTIEIATTLLAEEKRCMILRLLCRMYISS